MSALEYLRDPEAIYARSFELVRAETDLARLPVPLQEIAVRLVHACGMPDVVDDLDWRGAVAERGRAALGDGAPVLADCQMVVQGIIAGRLPAANPVRCTLDDPRVAAMARAAATTRSAAAVDLWTQTGGAVVAIGNAPTALFRLLERLVAGELEPPAAILAFPVGFVGAAESKRALMAHLPEQPALTVHGRRGGSALAAAAVNALAAPGR